MKIVILDGYPVNPGDLSWDALKEHGELTVYERTMPDEIISRAKDAEIVLTNKVVLTREILADLPKLRYIGILATGTNVVDIAAAHERGIIVANVPAYSTYSVAQLVFALLLGLIYHPDYYTEKNKNGYWSECSDFSYAHHTFIELAGRQLGIVGFGNIGQQVARIGAAIGMKIAVETGKPQESLPEGYVKMSREELFATSDVVTLHCPLCDDTAKMVNASLIKKMKLTAILINTARGGLLDENAVAEALREGRLAGVGVDVLSTEPPKSDNPLLTAPNIMIMPHIGWATFEARKRLIAVTAENVGAFLKGTPRNIV